MTDTHREPSEAVAAILNDDGAYLHRAINAAVFGIPAGAIPDLHERLDRILASQHTPSEEAKPSEVGAKLQNIAARVVLIDAGIAEEILAVALEAKPTTAAEVTDEVREALAYFRPPDDGSLWETDRKRFAVLEAALTRTGDLQAENKKFRIMFDAMDKDARRPSVVLVEKVFDLQAENERLLGVVDGMADDVAAYSELQYALADPEFVRVPREVLEGEKMHNESAVGEYADALLRTYGTKGDGDGNTAG